MSMRKSSFRVNVDPITTIMAGIMPKRYDAENTTMLDIVCDGMDEYIAKKKEETGVNYNYMHIVIAAMVRAMAMRPKLNRYTTNYRIYERYKITVCFVIKRSLADDAMEQVVKLHFNGNETLEMVREKIDDAVKDTLNAETMENKTDNTANILSKLPIWLIKFALRILTWMDRHNILPGMIEEASPFHCSFFITNLKSIKTESINHHCYEFGTTSIFFSLGKDKIVPVVVDGEVVSKKIFKLGVSCDERICDGLYYGRSFHAMQRIFNNPSLLEKEYHNEKVDNEIEKDRIAAEKKAKKQAKKNKNK